MVFNSIILLQYESEKLVPSEIKYYLGQNYEILVEIEEVDYFDTDFSRASHRLSLAEITEIVKYQSMDNV